MTFLILIAAIASLCLQAWLIGKLSKLMDELKNQVEATKGVIASAKTLLAGLHDRLVAAGTDPAKLSAITADLKTSTDDLAAAVAANPAE